MTLMKESVKMQKETYEMYSSGNTHKQRSVCVCVCVFDWDQGHVAQV